MFCPWPGTFSQKSIAEEICERVNSIADGSKCCDVFAPPFVRFSNKATIEAGTNTYATDCWGSSLDWSGVSWQKWQAGTLICDNIVLSARHFPLAFSNIAFTHPTTGQQTCHTIIDERGTTGITGAGPDTDMLIGLIDPPAPAWAKRYPLPDPSIGASQFVNSLVIYTDPGNNTTGSYDERKYGVGKVVSAGNQGGKFLLRWGVDEDKFDTDTFLGFAEVRDSGHPVFLLGPGNKMVLAGLHWFTNASSWYGEQISQTTLQNEIDAMLLANGLPPCQFQTCSF